MNAIHTLPEDDGFADLVPAPSHPKFEGFGVIASRAAALGLPVHPIAPGLKYPPLLPGFQHKATSDLKQIALWAQEFPQANAGAMATPESHIFLDEDNVLRIHELYRERNGEDYPRTYATESREGHRQTVWLQTDATRRLGNVTQGNTKELVMSVRQKNLYVMVAGSIHPDTKEPYRVVDDSPIIPMPDRLVEFILWLKSERKREIAAAKQVNVTPRATVTAMYADHADDFDDAEEDPPLLGGDRIYGEGERNNILSRYAYRRYIRELCTKEELFADVHEFNELHCSPPEDREKVDQIIAGKLSMIPTGNGFLRNCELQPTRKLTPESVAADAAVIAAYRANRGENSAAWQHMNVAPTDTEAPKPFVMVQGDSFMLEKIAPRRVLMRTQTRAEAVFYAKSINQVFAWRGNGKTCLGLALTAAFATGGSFLNFECPEPVNVLYIEGELPEEQMQERWKQIIGNTAGRARLVTIDKQPEHTFPSFASTEGMARVEATLSQCESEGFPVDVLFLDSVSTLFNIAANDEENWINIQTWLLRLRSQGLCIFFFHHAGKSGMSRSHSKSEDMLDVSIKLDTPDDKEEGVLHAILEFDKARHGISEPRAVIKMRPTHSPACVCNATKGKLVGCRGDSVSWEHEILTDLKKVQAFDMFARGVSVRNAAQDLGVNKSKVGRWREEYGRGVMNAIDQSAVKEKD